MQNCVGKSSADGGTFIFEFWRSFEFDFPSRSHHTSEIHFLCFFALFRLLAVCLSEICLLAYMLVSPSIYLVKLEYIYQINLVQENQNYFCLIMFREVAGPPSCLDGENVK